MPIRTPNPPTDLRSFHSPAMRHVFQVGIRFVLIAAGRMIRVEITPPLSQSASPCFFNLL